MICLKERKNREEAFQAYPFFEMDHGVWYLIETDGKLESMCSTRKFTICRFSQQARFNGSTMNTIFVSNIVDAFICEPIFCIVSHWLGTKRLTLQQSNAVILSPRQDGYRVI